MPANVHPDHADTHDELQNAIDNPTELSDAQMTKALNTLIDMLSSTEAEEQLMDEIFALSNSLVATFMTFRRIEELFVQMKDDKNSDSLKKDVDSMLETWADYRNTYVELLRESRSAAEKGEAAANNFFHDFSGMLVDDNVSIESKKAEIKTYMEDLAEDRIISEDVAKISLDLMHNVSLFYQDWRRLVDSHILDADAEHVRQMDADLDLLEATLRDLTDKVSKLSGALNAPTAGIVGVLSIINPIFMIAQLFEVIGSGISPEALDAAVIEQKDVISRIEAKEAERERALADLQTEKVLQAALSKSHVDLTSICNKLTAFGTVWSAIRADLQAIEEKLDYTVGTSSQSLFKSRLKTAAKLYEILGKALKRYQEGADLDKLIALASKLSGVGSGSGSFGISIF